MKLSGLCGGLCSSLMSLSAQNTYGTNVPLTTSNWQCATSHHFGNASYHPATGCSWPTSTASIPSVSDMPAPLMGEKWQHCSFDQGVSMSRQEKAVKLVDTPKKPPHHRWKEVRSTAKPYKENHQEAFSKESELVRMARRDY